MINKAGEVVGIIFDGNIESLAWNFEYSDKVARAVEVDSRAIMESLKNIYHADALVNEIVATQNGDAASGRIGTCDRSPDPQKQQWTEEARSTPHPEPQNQG